MTNLLRKIVGSLILLFLLSVACMVPASMENNPEPANLLDLWFISLRIIGSFVLATVGALAILSPFFFLGCWGLHLLLDPKPEKEEHERR